MAGGKHCPKGANSQEVQIRVSPSIPDILVDVVALGSILSSRRNSILNIVSNDDVREAVKKTKPKGGLSHNAEFRSDNTWEIIEEYDETGRLIKPSTFFGETYTL